MKNSTRLFTSRICFALVAALTFGGVPTAHSAVRTWTGGAGAVGVWGNNNNWGGVGFPQTTSDTATFTSVVGNSSTPTIYGNYSLLNLTFNSGAAAFTITTNGAGRSLTIVGTTTQNAANPQIISIPLTGASGVMTKAGTGTLVLTAVNTYSGATTINAGKLLGKSGGSVDSVVTVAATSATGAVQVAVSGGQWRCNGLTFSAAGVFSFDFNNGVAPHATTAPLQVNGDLAFTATPTVIILNDSIPTTTATYPLISYTGTASGTAPTAVTISPALTGGATAALRLDGSGKVLYLDVTGGVTPTKLAYTSVPATPQQGLAFSVTVQAQDAAGIGGNVTSDTAVTLSVGSGSGSLSGTTSGVITNGQNSVTISGVIYSAADTMTLTATPTAGMTGLTPVTSGSIAFASVPTKLAYTSVPTVGTVGTPFSVTVQSQDVGGAPRGVTSDTTVTLSKASGSGTLGGTTTGIITTGNNSVTISGVTYDTVDTMTLTASATAGMSLTAVTSGGITFTPPTQTLHWGANDAIWTDTGAWYNIGTSAAATYNDVAPDAVVLEDTHSGTGDRTITLNTTVSPASVTMTAGSKNFTISGSGAIGGSTGLSKSGAGALTLGTANTFSGDTRIGAGTLTLGHSSALAGSTLDMNTADSGSLSFDSVTAATLGGLKGTRNLVLTNAAGAGVTLTVGNNSSNTTYLGVLSGTGGFTKTGTGKLTLGNASGPQQLYTGDTTIIQGGLYVSGDTTLPSGQRFVLAAAGTLDFNGTNLNIGALDGSGGLITKTADNVDWSVTVGTGDASGSYAGAITNNSANGAGNTCKVSLIKVGSGTQTLSAINAIGRTSGPSGVNINGGRIVAAHALALGALSCTVNAGTLEIANLALSTQLALNLNNGATLMGSGGANSAFCWSGTGPRYATIGAGAAVTMATAASTDTLTANSTIKGGDATSLVTAAGPGTIILSTGSASDAYAGKWKLTGGTLRLNDINALGNSSTRAIELAGGILEGQASAAGTYSTATIVSSSSTITPNQAGAGANHTFGTLSINNSTLSTGPGAQITGGTTETNTFTTTTLTGDATLNITNNDTRSMIVVLGAVGESGGARALAKQGAGTLVITGIGTYTGGTTIAGGTIEIGVSGSIKGSVTVTGSQLKLDNASAMESAATLTLPASPSEGTVNLNFDGTQTINALYFGTTQKAAGTWGAVGSIATHQNSAFTGTGILNVSTGLTTTTALTDDTGSPTTYGAPVTFTATVTGSSPTGTVQFKDSVSNLGAPVQLIGGQAQLVTNNLSVSGSPHSITAVYSGDDNNNGSTSSAVPHVITAVSSTTVLISSLNPSTNGDNVTFTATVSSGVGTPTGDVVFKANTVPFSTNTLVSGSAAASTTTLPVGTNTVTAEYAAQANWLGSSASLDQVVKSSVVYSLTNAILSIVDLGAGSFDLALQGTPGAEYYVVASADVSAALSTWTPVTGSTNTAPDPSGQWSLTVSATAPQYYRLKAVNPAP